MDNNKDDDLLERIKDDDEVAFRSLYDKYYPFLCYASYKIYPDKHKAKDFAQEAFLDLWRKRKTLIIHTSINSYLRKIVIYKTIDYIRSQRLNFEKTPELEKNQVHPYEMIEYTELKTLIHRAADQLPERCRIIFFMSRFEKMSHKEIATKLGISTKTIENQITKALKILRNIVTNYLSEPGLILPFLSFFIGE